MDADDAIENALTLELASETTSAGIVDDLDVGRIGRTTIDAIAEDVNAESVLLRRRENVFDRARTEAEEVADVVDRRGPGQVVESEDSVRAG